MADLPEAKTSIDDEAGAFAGGTGALVVVSCVEKNADATPRLYGSTKNILAQHGYSQGADFSSIFFEEADKPILFIGVPTATPGTIGRQNSTGVTGSSAITAVAGAAGVLEETQGRVEVLAGGTIGTDQILLSLSCDNGRTKKTVRLGKNASYTIPYVGIVLQFGAGTLVEGDVFTWVSTAPMWDQAGLQAARAALAAQLKLTRSWLIMGDLPNAAFAGYVTTEVNGYETADDRFTLARTSVRDRLPLASMAKVKKAMTGAPSLTFGEVGATGDTITRSAGSWIADGFVVGDTVTVAGSAGNNVTGVIAALTATVLTFDTTDLVDEGPVAGCTVVGAPTLTFAEVGATGDTITRSSGSWLADGFAVGDVVTVAGTADNNVTGAIAALTATVLTLDDTDLAAESIRSDLVTVTKGETKAAWAASIDAAFASVDAQKRIDLSAGRARKVSPLTGWALRRPPSWAASIREYQHDVHIPTYRKADDPLDGWDLTDEDGNISEEWDERNDKALLAARFTCFRTWGNGPRGTFIALSLTRAAEGSLLSRTHNMYVANLACTTVQAAAELAVGQVLELNDDGTGTADSISEIERRVNTDLKSALLQQGKEGKRASKAVWRADKGAILNFPGAELLGTLDLVINGTLEKIRTSVRVITAGAGG